jgi:hypothetical protein
MNYNLDQKAAEQADNINARIEQKGCYLGMITRAESIESTKGTKGVDISFKAQTGETADYLTLWTHNKDGKQLMGYNTLMAIMTCLRVKSLVPEAGEIEKYNPDTKKKEKVTANLFKELMNKPVTLLMHMEEYEKTAGGTAWKPVIFAVCDKDGFTASEIFSKALAANTVEKMIAVLKDRPLKIAASTPRKDSENPAEGFEDFPF